MRILHVISNLSPASGGPTEVLRSLAKAQTEAGHQIAVCTSNYGGAGQIELPNSYFDEFYPDDVSLHAFPITFRPLLYSSSLGSWLRKSIQHFDIVHIHGLYRFPTTYAGFLARKRGVPFVITPHGALDPFLYDKSTKSIWLKRLYEKWFDLPNLNRANAIHYTADDERQRASFLALSAPTFVVPNGLDWERYRALPARGLLRARWGLGQLPTVLFLGRLHFKKGLDLLIPAFDALRRSIPNAQLVIAGPENDDYGLEVRKWVRERELENAVHIVGSLHGTDVVQAYVDSDVFALPSYTENFGMTVVEAMACCLPVVISDQVNIHADVAEAGAGLVTNCDALEVAEAMMALLQDDDRRREMGEAGRRLVFERYRWSKIVDVLSDEYATAIERNDKNK